MRTFEGCLKRMDLKYTFTLFRVNWQISEFPFWLLELPVKCEVRFALQCELSTYTFQIVLADFWDSFLPFGITRWCVVHFTVQWGLSKAVWKEWISNSLWHFSDWIGRFLSFLLAFWNNKMMWSPLYSAVRTFEGCLKRMDLKYTITLFRLNF